MKRRLSRKNRKPWLQFSVNAAMSNPYTHLSTTYPYPLQNPATHRGLQTAPIDPLPPHESELGRAKSHPRSRILLSICAYTRPNTRSDRLSHDLTGDPEPVAGIPAPGDARSRDLGSSPVTVVR